jgi:hypothetical protein
VHCPALAVPESGPAYVVAGVHDAIPDIASLPPNETPTDGAYQLLRQALGRAPHLADGAVASYRA